MKYCIQCIKNNIKRTASYGHIDEETPKYCSSCSKDKIGKIVNYKHGYCQEIINSDGKILSERLCCNNAHFNYYDSKIKKGIRCIEHKEDGMICIGGHLCKECNKNQASFIEINSKYKTATHCGVCKNKYEDKEFIDIIHKKCKNCNIKSATFGFQDNVKEYCKECVDKLNLNAIDLHHKKCIKCNNETALYNNEGNQPLYCTNCKNDVMILIYKLKCEKCNDKTPIFNYPGFKKGKFCKNCCEEGMINVKDKLCEKCNLKRPSFNIIGNKNPIYCNDCKTEYMINIYQNICEYDDCDDYALYNFENEKRPKYCNKHKEEEMISLKNNLCIFKDCKNQPSFNYENEKLRLYCSIHLLEGMVDISRSKCIICNDKRAIFNNYGQKTPLYCLDHKTSFMINIEHKLCLTNMCGKRAIKKYENYCLTCYIYQYPERPLSRNYKTKESDVVKFILNKFPQFSWISDKKILDGCSSKRPDLLLDLGYLVINIEIDENQHKSYEEICENKRLMMISKDINHRNLILIRFNPDSYSENGIKKLSCWNINKETGQSTIKKSHEKEWINRLKKLEETINYWINPEINIDKMIHIVHLFFDEFDEIK
jgi:hypothetical protein